MASNDADVDPSAEDEAEPDADIDAPDEDEAVSEDESAADQEFEPADSSGDQGGSSPKRADEQFCSSCGSVIKKEAEICPECGVSQSKDSDNNPGVAALLSGIGLIIPIAAGAGQVYNGQLGKGIALSVIQVINAMLMLVLIGFVTYPIVGIYAVYDAYNNA